MFKDYSWSNKDYQNYEKYLISLQDIKYRDFHLGLTTTKYEIIGIKVPILRNIAKEIFQGNYKKYLQTKDNNYYEEIFIRGFVISKIKDLDLLIKEINNYVKLIDNWAICDSFCNSLKIIAKNKELFWPVVLNYINSNNEFITRVGIVLILNYYIDDNYYDEIVKIFNNLNSDKYYINMAIAWTICEMYIKYKDKTIKFLQKNNLNSFVQNKAISKIRDSYRVTKEEKEYLNSLKY